MGKTYLESVKYIIKINFEISGVVDKPDIIGAVFGQSEGLLGEEMDLRELQKNGRVGRIEIQQSSALGKTKGLLTIPSSMDTVETSVLAAAVESVDKVGPFESSFKTINIEDTRNLKRKEISDRATELLRRLLTEQIPDSGEIAEEVRAKARTADIRLLGPDKVPAGPSIKDEDSIIVVEGRADVLNLLKNNIKNVIGMNGAKPSKTIIDLCKQKTVTLFIDGDRGGELNLRKLQELTDVDFVARAPDGKEVEELTRKEIVMALRRKIPAEQANTVFKENNNGRGFQKSFTPRPFEGKSFLEKSFARKPMVFPQKRFEQNFPRQARFPSSTGFRKPLFFTSRATQFSSQQAQTVQAESSSESTSSTAINENLQQFQPLMEALKGSLKAKLLDEKDNELSEVSVRELLKELKEKQGVKTIVFDGIITKRLLEEAKKAGVKTIVGAKKGKIEESSEVKVLTINA